MLRIAILTLLTICCGCSNTQKRAYEMALSRTHAKHFQTAKPSGLITPPELSREYDRLCKDAADSTRQRLMDADQADADCIAFDRITQTAADRESTELNAWTAKVLVTPTEASEAFDEAFNE